MIDGIRHATRRFFARTSVYSIGIYAGDSPLALAPPAGVNNPVLTRQSVTDVPASFVADPFMIRVDGSWYMFFEVMTWRGASRVGVIALATSRDGLSWSYQRVVLEEPYHLSYPYVFTSGSDHYLIPESRQGGAVRLYRADPFPHRWTFVANLLTGPALSDNSVFQWDGKWWMFTQTSVNHDTLRLFHAEALEGPWTEHPRSPIVDRDARIARPAGRVISLSDRPVRFAQDCRTNYGSRVHAIEITSLTTRDYAEAELDPAPILNGSGKGWNAGGMHHVDAHLLDDGRWIACVDGWHSRMRRPEEIARWALHAWR
jgi:hypothetical protein